MIAVLGDHCRFCFNKERVALPYDVEFEISSMPQLPMDFVAPTAVLVSNQVECSRNGTHSRISDD
jgi:hypothetical protein